MTKQESIFLSYVRYVLRRWTGFQLSIDHGMGGPYGREKEIWFGNEIENYFTTHENVKSDDIEEFMNEILNLEFENTCFEDGSVVEISRHLCEAFLLSLTNPESEIFLRISSLNMNSIQTAISSSKMDTDCNEDNFRPMEQNMSIANVLEKEMKELTVNEQTESPEAADGWITVTKGKKRK